MALINKIIRQIYNNYFNHYGNSFKSVRWSSEKEQYLRFKNLIELFGFESQVSVNDLGCGLGHLLKFIDTKKINYYGYDLSDSMINEAKEIYPELSLNFFPIKNATQLRLNDYTVASGVFNDRLWLLSEKLQKKRVFEILKVMWIKSRRGIAFNFLISKPNQKKYDGLLYFKIEEMYDFCKKIFSDKIKVIDSYSEEDITFHILR